MMLLQPKQISVMRALEALHKKENLNSRQTAISRSDQRQVISDSANQCTGRGRLGSDVDPFGNRQGVVDFDAKISHRAFELGVAEQQ